jgi:primosomal protein N' (replication factor Y)
VIARVEPLTTARALRGPFDYRVPAEMEGVEVGSVLLVPFGPRRTLGVVVELAETTEIAPERLAEPVAALEQDVPAELVRLGLWVAEEWCSTPARGLALVLPPGTGTGRRAPVGARRALVVALTPDAAGEGAGPRKPTGMAEPAARLGTRQLAVLDALRAGPVPAAALVRRTGAGHATVRALEARGLVTVTSEEYARAVSEAVSVGATAPAGRALTTAQEAALAAALARLDAPPGADRRVLLQGVTGSGKTEVYLRAVAAALERGRSAIVLVPEIALTPQTAGRFRERFGSQVAVLHSGLRPGERYEEWRRLRRGDAKVCVGPRSAVFAPVADLGLIVVDEEHDASYKQDSDPRYDARRVAERRAREAGAALVLGSATPRPESVEHLPRTLMPTRVDGGPPPPVELVSALEADGPLHPRVREALDRVRRRGEKAIVLLNRRGWSNFLSCRSCGRVWGCPECDVSLVLHRSAGRLSCHHCGHGERVPRACPDCGSVSVARHGTGTERLEEELAAALAPLPVMRLDADSGSGPAEVLARFDAAPSGVLVGTQMVAKGHDFPDVTLGVVLDADATLRFPDFRAEERTFALVAQLAGRSGRGPRGGRVVVQAVDPDARALRLAAAHDSEGFVRSELERRRALRYPPFGHLVRVVCSSPEPGPETHVAERLRDRMAATTGEDTAVLGPAPLFRRGGRHRAQIMVKSTERIASLRAVREAVEAAAPSCKRAGVALAVDVDPH